MPDGHRDISGRTEFVMGRHSYCFKALSPQAKVFTAFLGAYGLLPVLTDGYNLFNNAAYERVAKSSLYDLREADAAGMLEFWNGVVRNLIRNESFKGADQWLMVTENAKRRLPTPVFVKGGRWLLVYEAIGDAAKAYDPDDPDNKNLVIGKADVERAFDSLKYMKALAGINSIVVRHGKGGVTLSAATKTALPRTLTKPEGVSQSVSEGALTLTASGPSAGFTAGTLVTFGADGLPDITGDTNAFNPMIFSDMRDAGAWYWEYVYRAVDAGIMNGDAEGTMRPGERVKRGELIKIAMAAIGKTCPNADGKGAHWAANYYGAARADGWTDAGTADLFKYLEEYITRRETIFIFWKAFQSSYRVRASRMIPAADPGVAYYRGIFKNPGEADVLVKSGMYEAFYQLNRNCIIIGDPQDADGKIAFRVNDALSRAECAKIAVAFLFGLDADAPVFGRYRGVLTTGGTAGGVLNADGLAAFDLFVPKTALYEIGAGGPALTVTVNGAEVFEKYNRAGAYPLTAAEKAGITVKGKAGAGFSIKVSAPLKGKPLAPSDRAVYIMLYDSPDKKANGFDRNRYLGTASGGRYLYGKGFFKNYLALADGKNVKFCVSVRDLDYDKAYNSDHVYGNGDISARIAVIEPQIKAAVNNIIDLIKSAKAEMPGVTVPGIYIGSPHLYGAAYADSGDIAEKRKFAEGYAALTKRIYDSAVAAAGGAVPVEGVYYGREEPVMPGAVLKESVGYLAMEAVSRTIHTRYSNKKMVWVPYVVGVRENLEGIGKIANAGVFAHDGRTYDLCDAVIMQPGYFYSEIGSVPAAAKKELMEGDMRVSIAEQAVYARGNVVGGGKITDTALGFQMEYDMSLVTGRWLNYLSTPKMKAQYLRETISAYKPMIDAGNVPFGIYSGGPNEQRYEDVSPTGNFNRHSIMNHQSCCGKTHENWGDDEQYRWFTSEKIMESEGGNPDFGHNGPFNGMLIYNITKGLLGRGWDASVNKFLGSDFK